MSDTASDEGQATSSPVQPSSDICGVDTSDDDRVPWNQCEHPAGWGTKHQGSGLCILHEDDEEELPNYGLFEPNHGYYARQDQADREKLEKIAYDITQRFMRVQGMIDEVDKEVARQLAVDMHLVRRSSEYVAQPLLQKTSNGDEKINKLIHQHRRLQESVIERMKKLGIMQDPETKKAQAEESKADSWRSFMEEEF
jgi:hypothetical protein